MKIVTILGARPQFIKASAFSRAIRRHNESGTENLIEEVIIHTGQHFDKLMSDVFFSELDIPHPKYNLGISGLSHAAMTGRMLEEIEKVLLDVKPQVLLVYGDTNSTLAGALAASKLHIPIVHIEAGLRSFNMRMPEEVNRILTDKISSFLFCPTQTSIKNLENEGVHSGVFLTGDIMLDVTNYYRGKAEELISLDTWGVSKNNYNLATIHRAENTDDQARLISILSALREISNETPVILPLHPRTLQLTVKLGIQDLLNGLRIIEPLSYLPMTKLQMNAKTIITDSGGIQKEAFFHKVPCITLRDETEWIETVELGWNIIAGANKEKILQAYKTATIGQKVKGQPYGDGSAADKILQTLKEAYI